MTRLSAFDTKHSFNNRHDLPLRTTGSLGALKFARAELSGLLLWSMTNTCSRWWKAMFLYAHGEQHAACLLCLFLSIFLPEDAVHYILQGVPFS